MHARPDVVVIGAGIIGIMAATALARDNKSVLLLDKTGIAKGASFGNAAAFAFSDVVPLASPGIMRKAPRWLLDPLGPLSIPPAYALRVAPWLYRFWRASGAEAFETSLMVQAGLMRLARTEMARTVAEAGLSAFVRSDGCLEVYESDKELTASLTHWSLRERERIEFRHIDRAEIDALQPGLSPRFVRGTFVPQWQTVSEPHQFATALAERVLAGDASFRQAEVRRVERAADGVRVVLSDGSSVDAAQAVIAGGAWSKTLAAGLGDPVPLETERGYNTTLPPGAFDLKRQIVFGGHGFVVTPLSTGIRVGGAVELGGLERPPNFARSKAMLAKAKTFLPSLDTANGTEWMGFRPSMPDSLPVIGHASASRSVVYAFGHGHLGLTQSAATGRLVADLLAGRPPAIDVAPLRATRF